MQQMKENPSRVLILGAGRGGSSLLDILIHEPLVTIVGVADKYSDTPAMRLARECGITTYTDAETAIKACKPCTAFNLTHDHVLDATAVNLLGPGSVIGGLEAKLMWKIVTRLKTIENELRFEASHDPLTGIYNRRHAMQTLRKDIGQSMRYHFAYSLAMLDLDHFKSVNDQHGHIAGDTVLKSVVDTICSSMRDVDTMGRWGGEEFMILLPHTTKEHAMIAVKNWLARVNSKPVVLPDGVAISVSFSAGVAQFSPCDGPASIETSVEHLIHLADEHMYQAKKAGRHCVVGGDAGGQQGGD